MDHNIFKIRRAFLMPFSAIVVLLGLLLLLSLSKGQPLEKIILAVFFAGTLLVGIEAAERKIILTPDGLKIKKFFRTKNIIWAKITHLGVFNLNKKAYFLLTTTRGFYFFSNMYENHALLIRYIVDKLDAEKVEVEVTNYLENPLEWRSVIVSCWLVVLIIIAFIIQKLLLI
ncbi:MAG: hypothetical protein WC373_10820 [Smithella sp.]